MTASTRPLDGVRVLSVEQAWAGPVGTLALASLGAEVIRVESAARPDNVPDRRVRLGAFTQVNRNKRGITLDLRREGARSLFLELVALSDVVVENFARRVMAGFRLDYDSLLAVKPDLIMVSSTGYGHEGPYADYKAWGPNLETMGGIAWQTRHRGEGFLIPGGGGFSDTVAGHFAAMGVVAALLQRDLTGEGGYIDLSQYESVATFAGEALLAEQLGQPQDQMGNEHPWMAPHGVYACAGEFSWIAIAVENDAQWAALVHVMGDPGWALDAGYATRQGRLERRDEIDARLEDWTRTQDRDTLGRRLQAAGVPAAAAQDGRDVVLDERFWRRGALELVDLAELAPDLGASAHNGPLWRFARTELHLQDPPPAALGRDNDYAFGELLGLSPDELRAIESNGVAGRTAHAAEPRPEPPLEELKRSGAIVDFDPDFKERIRAAVDRAKGTRADA